MVCLQVDFSLIFNYFYYLSLVVSARPTSGLARQPFYSGKQHTHRCMHVCTRTHIHTHTHTHSLSLSHLLSLTHSSTKVGLFLDIVIEASFKFALWKLLTELYMFLFGLIVSHTGVRRVKLKVVFIPQVLV